MSDDQERRVLVVEDDENVRRLVTALLRHAGYATDIARDGIEAVDYLCDETRRAGVTAMLLDINMPRMNGNQLLDLVRYHEPAFLRRIIVMSAGIHADVAQLTGVCRIMPKPFDNAELIAAIGSCAP